MHAQAPVFACKDISMVRAIATGSPTPALTVTLTVGALRALRPHDEPPPGRPSASPGRPTRPAAALTTPPQCGAFGFQVGSSLS